MKMFVHEAGAKRSLRRKRNRRYLRLFKPNRIFACIVVICTAAIGYPAATEALIGTPFADEVIGLEAAEAPQLSVADTRLGQTGFVVTPRTFQQVFEPYINARSPVFITTDTVLSAFHVLWRQSLYRLESANAERLTRALRWIWSQIEPDENPRDQTTLQGPSETMAKTSAVSRRARVQPYHALRKAARQRARLVIAVALHLMDDPALQLSGQLKNRVESESERIIRAEGYDIPVWDQTRKRRGHRMDYADYRPYGFYQVSDKLIRYYKTIRWLQNVPFRVAEDDELLAMLILGQTLNVSEQVNSDDRLDIHMFFNCYRELAGSENPWDLLLAAQVARDRPGSLDQVRHHLIARTTTAATEAHPQLPATFEPTKKRLPAETQFHILALPTSPETMLFQKTVPLNKTSSWPSGLEIMAVLGSRLAKQQILEGLSEKRRLLFEQVLDDMANRFSGRAIYQQYLYCLKALLDEPEPDAPFFMVSDQWGFKNVNTALAGWTQNYGKWMLPLTRPDHPADTADAPMPFGLVEPEPEFYARLSELVDRLIGVWERNGVFNSAQHLIAGDLRFTAQLIRELRYPQAGALTDHFSTDDITRIENALLSLAALDHTRFLEEDFKQRRAAAIAQIEALAEAIEDGRYDRDPTFQAMVLEIHRDLKHHWQMLGRICRRLEVLSHKQLRGVGFNERENTFINEFGLKLASILQCDRNRPRFANCKGPVLATIYTNKRNSMALYAGIGYPQEIIVRYPHGNTIVQCTGAILPYFELLDSIRHPSETWQWQPAFNAPSQPPDWFVKNLMAPQQLSKTSPLVP